MAEAMSVLLDAPPEEYKVAKTSYPPAKSIAGVATSDLRPTGPLPPSG